MRGKGNGGETREGKDERERENNRVAVGAPLSPIGKGNLVHIYVQISTSHKSHALVYINVCSQMSRKLRAT